MTLLDILNEYPLVKDDTQIGLILWDPETGHAIAQIAGHWFEDHILKYMNHEVIQFMYWAGSNRMLVRISQEGANQ